MDCNCCSVSCLKHDKEAMVNYYAAYREGYCFNLKQPTTIVKKLQQHHLLHKRTGLMTTVVSGAGFLPPQQKVRDSENHLGNSWLFLRRRIFLQTVLAVNSCRLTEEPLKTRNSWGENQNKECNLLLPPCSVPWLPTFTTSKEMHFPTSSVLGQLDRASSKITFSSALYAGAH